MSDEIQYFLANDGQSIEANFHGRTIGQITFVRVGIDKMIIDYTGVDENFRHRQIGLNLVRNAANLARSQGRHIIALCPFAGAMFARFPEFDDVRLLNAH